MQTLPEVGKIYVSRTDPTYRMYVEAVHVIEADNDIGNDETFSVEACDPAHKGNMGEVGYDFSEEDWLEHDFSLETAQI